MTRETVRQAFRAFGITQADLARAAGLSEAAVSRQLSGSLHLTERVERAAEELLIVRGAQIAARILDWVDRRRCVPGDGREVTGNGSA